MNLNWRKSSYSGGEGNCVEVCRDRSRILARDTENRAGAILRFSPDVWRKFTGQVKAQRPLGSVYQRPRGTLGSGGAPAAA